MARRIRDEHGGLSIAMSAASIAVKNKLSSTWSQLKSLRHKSKPMPMLAELCLLICCMFPDDSRIPVDDLATYLMGLKLFEDVDDMFAARCRVYDLISIINDLKYPNNVIDGKNRVTREKDGPNDYHVDMLVGARDLAKLIPISSPLVFRLEIVKEKWPELNWCKDCYGLSLMLKKVNEHPANLECPKLALLFLQYKEDSQSIPVDFFKGMEQLQVLCLDVPSLPQSFDVLRNLRTLHLKLLKFDDISLIGDLTNLEYLSISASSLIDIPREMGQLENLRFLDLRRMNIAYISPDVLSRMLKLEELYLPLSFKRWGCKVKEEHGDYDKWGSGEVDNYDDERRINVSLDKINDMERINASLNEMAYLSLKTLQVSIPEASMLPEKSPMFKNIQDFKILLPSNVKYQPFGRCPKNELQLKGDALEIKESGICDLTSRTGDLSLTRVRNLKNVIF